jgi:F420-0:gamma-glutamyl ligase-like protein
MTKYKAMPITTRFWKPKTDYLTSIVKATTGKIKDGDFIIVPKKQSQQHWATYWTKAKSRREPMQVSWGFWMCKIWGNPLGICVIWAASAEAVAAVPH